MPTYTAVYKHMTENIITCEIDDAICITEVLCKIDAGEMRITNSTNPVLVQRSIISIEQQPDYAAHAAIELGTK
jgi:hypothetical protein